MLFNKSSFSKTKRKKKIQKIKKVSIKRILCFVLKTQIRTIFFISLAVSKSAHIDQYRFNSSITYFSYICAITFLTVIRAHTIDLPPGVAVEGVTHGRGSIFFAGSIPTGDIVLIDAKSGLVSMIVRAPPNRSSLCVYSDGERFIFSAGSGPFSPSLTADALPNLPVPKVNASLNVYEIATGNEVVSCVVNDGILVNDVTADKNFAYFTDSLRPYLYQLRLSSFPKCDVTKILLPKDIFGTSNSFSNGIARFAEGLIVGNSRLNALYFVDLYRNDNRVTEIIAPGQITSPDTMEVKYSKKGPLLYVTQISLNTILVYKLSLNRSTRKVSATRILGIKRPFFEGTTTVAVSEDTILVPNLNVTALRMFGTNAILNIATVPVPFK